MPQNEGEWLVRSRGGGGTREAVVTLSAILAACSVSSRVVMPITGRSFDLRKLGQRERQSITVVYGKYRKSPDWSTFSAWWTKELDQRGLDDKSSAYRRCQDLEAKLGIAQGKVAPPDYRDYLADLLQREIPACEGGGESHFLPLLAMVE